MEKSNIKKYLPYFVCLLVGMLSGLSIALLNPGQNPWVGWVGGSVLYTASFILIYCAWRWSQSPVAIAICMLLAFILRLGLGMIISGSLPVWGYDEPAPRNGYLYSDAYKRDVDAWKLAQSNDSLLSAFGNEFISDQYGGLLSLSAAVYRVFSPDAHRSLLILVLTALAPALGIPFLWKALHNRWNDKLANLSCWVFGLYPESIILSCSQMREPFIIGLSAMAFFGVIAWQTNRRNSLLLLLASCIGIAFFSFRAAMAIVALLAVWFWFDNVFPNLEKSRKKFSWIVIGIIVFSAILIGLNWLVNSARWDLYLMEASSGRIQFELDNIGNQFRVPFIVGYGLLQPVLPAAIAYPGILLMRLIAIFRASGWYAILPALFFSGFSVWKIKSLKERRIWIIFFLAIVIWSLISSIRAGGDQWDNVRYRAIFTTWITLLASWGFLYAIENKIAWLKRIYAIEGIFVLAFLQWYLSRYYLLFGRFRFWTMVLVIMGLSSLIIIAGFIIDHLKEKRTNSH